MDPQKPYGMKEPAVKFREELTRRNVVIIMASSLGQQAEVLPEFDCSSLVLIFFDFFLFLFFRCFGRFFLVALSNIL